MFLLAAWLALDLHEPLTGMSCCLLGRLGLWNNPKRFNVAITRAKVGDVQAQTNLLSSLHATPLLDCSSTVLARAAAGVTDVGWYRGSCLLLQERHIIIR